MQITRGGTSLARPPHQPFPSYPADGEILYTLTPVLTAGVIAAADTYDVQIATDSDFATIIDEAYGLITPSYQATLSIGTTYHWRWASRNALGASAWSAVRSMVTTYDLISNLSAWWFFGESGGTRRNSYQDAVHAVDSSSVGALGGRADFVAASSDHLTVPDAAGIALGTDTAFTWTINFNADILNTGFLLAKNSSGASNNTYEYAIFLAASGNISLRVGNGSTFATVTTTGANLQTGTDYQVIAGHDPAANIISIRIGSGTLFTAAWTGGTRDGSDDLAFGRAGEFNGQYYDGRLWNAGFWLGRYLTNAEQLVLVNNPYPFGIATYEFAAVDPDDVDDGYSWHDFSDAAALYTNTAKTIAVASNNDPIRVAANKFAGTVDLTAPNDTVRPLWRTNQQNGLAVGEWDGVDTQLDHLAWGDADFTAFWVVKNADMVLGSHIAEGGRYLAMTGTSYDADPRSVMHFSDNTAIAASLPNPDGWNIIELVRSGGTWSILANGQDLGTVTNAVTFLPDTIGPNYVSGATFDGWWFEGQLGERIRYSEALDARTRAQIRAGIAAKWGISNVFYQPYIEV